MATNIDTCDLCTREIFNVKSFQSIFLGPDYDDDGGVWLTRSMDQAQTKDCTFCALLCDLLSKGDQRSEELCAIRVYATSLQGQDSSDISVLFLDGGVIGCQRYTIYTVKDDIASKHVSTRKPNPIINSQDSFDVAKNWLIECTEDHELCRQPSRSLPTRVLDVTPIDDHAKLRLINTKGIDAPYVTLSYCWGAPQPRMLTTKNVNDYFDHIDETTMPKTIQDAINVVRSLGLRYIWVDALCILQDSGEDKAHEIQRMADIYKHSYLTVMASSAATCEDGFLERNNLPESLPVVRIPYLKDTTIGSVYLQPWTSSSDYDPTGDPVSQRAWIFQERMLSSRLLMYPGSPHPMQWQCLTTTKSDGGPPPAIFGDGVDQLGPYFYSQDAPKQNDKEIKRLWAKVLQNYTSRFLTVGSDKLPGIAGVASEFGRVRQSNAGKYCAGMWRNDMPLCLLWRLFPADNKQFSNEVEHSYRAPSWSWASTDVQVLLPTQLETHPYHFEIVDCKVTPTIAGVEYGEIADATLTVNAMLKKCIWERHPRRLLDGDTTIGQGVADEVLARGKGEVWCMPILDAKQYNTMFQATGLLLEETGGKYKRVGVMLLGKHDWFEECEVRRLTLI